MLDETFQGISDRISRAMLRPPTHDRVLLVGHRDAQALIARWDEVNAFLSAVGARLLVIGLPPQ